MILRRSSAAVTAQLLLGGPLSIFGDELLKGELENGSPNSGLGSQARSAQRGKTGQLENSPGVSLHKSKSATVLSTGKASRRSLNLKRVPFVDHRTADSRKMKELSKTYE